MSVYNGLPFVTAAIDSILDQTFRDFELVLIDDGSTDGSAEVLQSCAARDSRIRLIRQENAGLTRALIRGVSEARAAVIARMDADDISLPGRLAAQLALLDADPDVILASCHLGFIDEVGARTGGHDFLDHPRELTPLLNVFANSFGGHGQMMFRKSAYQQAGGYDPEFRYAQDYDLWDRMLRNGGVSQVDAELYLYRINTQSISIRNRQGQQDCRFRVMKRAYRRITGRDLADPVARTIGAIWDGRTDEPLSALDVLRADRALAALLRASAGGSAERRALLQPVQLQLSERFNRLRWTATSGRLATLALRLSALRWKPDFLRAVARKLTVGT